MPQKWASMSASVPSILRDRVPNSSRSAFQTENYIGNQHALIALLSCCRRNPSVPSQITQREHGHPELQEARRFLFCRFSYRPTQFGAKAKRNPKYLPATSCDSSKNLRTCRGVCLGRPCSLLWFGIRRRPAHLADAIL